MHLAPPIHAIGAFGCTTSRGMNVLFSNLHLRVDHVHQVLINHVTGLAAGGPLLVQTTEPSIMVAPV